MILYEPIDVFSYEYHYPIEEWVMQEFKKRPKKNQNFIEFLSEFAFQHILHGVRHYPEDADWQRLLTLMRGRIFEYKQGFDFPTRETFILLDHALLLEHDGNDIPNLLK